ncbi:zinc ribbon domain-containing protein [Paracoccus ravus]|uniref:zinc ribbon domain-containing protein n=1 Tax=Paracoccus ravus TaxID=2447760 RepID=UPI0014306C93|nr:zinc ribbon domain-containing protein [Paracoccus ravus]
MLERARAATEAAWWAALPHLRGHADAIIARIRAEIPDKAKRKKAPWDKYLKEAFPRRDLDRFVTPDVRARNSAREQAKNARQGLPNVLLDGVYRDLIAVASSYIGLVLGDHPAEWPTPQPVGEDAYHAGLALLAASTDKADEDRGRDMMARLARGASPRPFTISRARECRIVCDAVTGRMAAELLITQPSWSETPATINAGRDACTGEDVIAATSRRAVMVPLEMSDWHRNTFLHGKAKLRSCLISREGEAWFMRAQFQMPKLEPNLTGAVLGIDRGLRRGLVASVVRGDGSVMKLVEILGREMVETIHAAEKRNRVSQRWRARPAKGYRKTIDQELQRATNRIVAWAKEYGAQVALEDLSGFKSAITAKRPKGTRRNAWQKSLKKMQMHEVERMLAYKLAVAGLPAPITVNAGGTSMTCPACGHCAKVNRPAPGAPFACVACGFEADSDDVGAVNIARRGAVLKRSRGLKMADLEKDMVADLRGRDDGGLGPLRAGAGSGVVAVRVSGGVANDDPSGSRIRPSPGAEDHPHPGKTGSRSVLASRPGAFSQGPESHVGAQYQGLVDRSVEAVPEMRADGNRVVAARFNSAKSRRSRKCGLTATRKPRSGELPGAVR